MANLTNRKYEIIGAAADLTTYLTEQEVVLSANTKAPTKTLRSIQTKDYTAGANGDLEVQLSGIAVPSSSDLFVLSLSAKKPLDTGQKTTERFRITGVASIAALVAALVSAINSSQGSSYSAANAGATTFDIIEKPIAPLTAGEVDLWGGQSTGAITVPGFKLSVNGDIETVTIQAVNTPHASPIGSPLTMARDLGAGKTIIGTVPAAASAETYDVIELQYEDVYTHGNPVSAIASGYVIDTVYVPKTGVSAGDTTHYKTFAAGVSGHLGLGAGGTQTIANAGAGTTKAQQFVGGSSSVTSTADTNEVALMAASPVGTVGVITQLATGKETILKPDSGTVNGTTSVILFDSTAVTLKKTSATAWTAVGAGRNIS